MSDGSVLLMILILLNLALAPPLLSQDPEMYEAMTRSESRSRFSREFTETENWTLIRAAETLVNDLHEIRLRDITDMQELYTLIEWIDRAGELLEAVDFKHTTWRMVKKMDVINGILKGRWDQIVARIEEVERSEIRASA